jgi:hypothetical protein
LDIASRPAQVWDQGFFRVTGIVMIAGTLILGAITLSLAISTAKPEAESIAAITAAVDGASP